MSPLPFRRGAWLKIDPWGELLSPAAPALMLAMDAIARLPALFLRGLGPDEMSETMGSGPEMCGFEFRSFGPAGSVRRRGCAIPTTPVTPEPAVSHMSEAEVARDRGLVPEDMERWCKPCIPDAAESAPIRSR